MTIKFPGLSIRWRDGRPRYEPGPDARKAGFRGRDLKHHDGRWYTAEEAEQFGQARRAELTQRHAGPGASPSKRAAGAAERSLGDLLLDWLGSEHVLSRSTKTRDGYRRQVDAVLYRPQRAAGRERQREPISLALVHHLGVPEIDQFFWHQRRARGHHMALASKAVISAALSWGRRSPKWRLGPNPLLGVEFERPAPRLVIYSDAEIRALVAAADQLAMPSIGDAILLGLFTGQRQGDRLALVDDGLVRGRRRFRQSKTGTIVEMPEMPQLAARLNEARTRVAALRLKHSTRPETVIVCEATGQPYKADHYRHCFAAVRQAASTGIAAPDNPPPRAGEGDRATRGGGGCNEPGWPRNEPVWLVEPCPSVAGKRDQDLRDTAVTWLARAGSTLPEIASITGHSLQSIHSILKHYLAVGPELADSAIDKLRAWMEREGIAI